ncbi:MAG: hypothetical protein P9X27_02545 [Candidatus Kaelpia aquatica]|nr:hypothetical protein [Candidatus Kaelpia aquatica]
MLKLITRELKEHAPFTALGAVSGVIIMVLFSGTPRETSYNIFYILHPLHVLFSALVTASMYKLYKCKTHKVKCNILVLLAVGYFGSIGIATISDSIIPYIGEAWLNMPHRHVHIGFIEKWYLVNPLAIIGIAIAYFRPSTKIPHYGHVLLSTWASLFHIMMAKGDSLYAVFGHVVVFIFLFLAVWIPCCISDIVFPLMFVKDKK